MSSKEPANSGATRGSGDNSFRLLLKLLSLWLGANALLWFTPALWETGKQALVVWQRERDVAYYETRSFDDGEPGSPSLAYLFFRPDLAVGHEAPLVLVLHGSGERGNDCRRQLATAGTFLVEPAFQASHPCFVVAPQCPENLNWRSVGDADVQHAVAGIIDELARTESIDERRIYLIGYSLGAYGCWHYLATMPDRFAGCIAVAGGGDPDTAAAVASTPIWAIHGENDTVVRPEQSQRMVDAVVGEDGDAKLTLLEKVDHGSFRVVKQTPNEYLEWLFKQQRSGGAR